MLDEHDITDEPLWSSLPSVVSGRLVSVSTPSGARNDVLTRDDLIRAAASLWRASRPMDRFVHPDEAQRLTR